MSISENFWNEISTLEITDPLSELTGFLLGSGEIDFQGNVFVSFRRAQPVRRAIEIMEMLQGTYEVQFHRRRSTSSRQTYVVKSHLPKEVFGSVSCLVTGNLNWHVIRGIMLSTGYLSDLNPWYHATLDVEVLEQARRVEQWLSKRVGRVYLLTKQSTNTIHLRSFEALYKFVDGLGAVKTREDIYAHHFMREKKISAQRLANCDNANLKRQVTKYEYHKKLFETGDLTKLTDVEFSILKLRAEHPEFSYGDIAEKLGVSKSKVARTLRKIEEKLSG